MSGRLKLLVAVSPIYSQFDIPVHLIPLAVYFSLLGTPYNMQQLPMLLEVGRWPTDVKVAKEVRR